MTDAPLIRCPLIHTADFTPCDPGETRTLVLALEENRACSGAALTFPRGTITPDGRLDCCKQSLGPEGVRRIATAMQHSTHIRALLLGTNGLGDDGTAAVASLTRDHPSLETLYLGCNRIQARGAAALCEAVSSNPRLRSLWLKRNPLGDDGVAAVAGMLARSESLELLDLVNCGMSGTGFRALLDGVAANRSLTHLYLGSNGLQPAAGAPLAASVAETPKLRHLFLDVNQLSDSGAEALAEIQLTTLSVASNQIGAVGLRAVCRRLPASLSLGHARSAAALGAEANAFGDGGAALLAEALPASGMVKLKLGQNALTPRGVERLLDAAALCPTLAVLEMSVAGLPPWTRRQVRETQALIAARGLSPCGRSPFEVRSLFR